jgi:hypothetical protein
LYLQWKSLTKSISGKNPLKSVEFWIPRDILEVQRNLNWIPADFDALKQKS